MTDTLTEFLLSKSASDVERERTTTLAKARLESFGLKGHREMLNAHQAQLLKFSHRDDQERRDVHLGAARLAEATAEGERWRLRQPLARPKAVPIKRMQPTEFTDTQLAVALAAPNGKKN